MMQDVELLRAACCVAGLDGTLDPEELPPLRDLVTRTGVGRASLNAMLDAGLNDRDFYKRQDLSLQPDPAESMRTLLAVATADGNISVNERVILQHFAKQMSISEDDFQRMLSAAEAGITNRPTPPTDTGPDDAAPPTE